MPAMLSRRSRLRPNPGLAHVIDKWKHAIARRPRRMVGVTETGLSEFQGGRQRIDLEVAIGVLEFDQVGLGALEGFLL